MRSDEQLKANVDDVRLLAQVALGNVTHEGVTDPYLLDGHSVRLQLSWLAKADLIDLRIGGPPVLAPRGERLLRELIQEHRNTG